MKIKNVFFGVITLCRMSCVEKQEKVNIEVDKIVSALKSTDGKKAFLENIFEADQRVRDSEKSAQIVTQFGNDSKEHKDYVREQWRQDEINLIKVETFIKFFGYPSQKELGEYAALAPWIVIHHSSDVSVRNRNFKDLYRAYLSEDIDDNALAMYLGRTYRFIEREDFYIESPFKAEDEINGLIEALGLEKEKLSILQAIKN